MNLLQHIESNKQIIKLETASSFVEISLTEGTRVLNLVLENNKIIDCFDGQNAYENSFASSILFPFANRIAQGKYSFNNKEYKLQSNTTAGETIHGLVYNKTFKIIENSKNENQSDLILEYIEETLQAGFPYKYKVVLHYTLLPDSLHLKVNVSNIGEERFPFTIGWHPYFYTSNRSKSKVEMDILKEVQHDKNMIGLKEVESTFPNIFEIENKKLDHCFKVKNGLVRFSTPDYRIAFSSNAKENYFQIYTPELENQIALEPISGPSNSFNNKLGLQILEAKKTFHIQWNIKLESN